MKYLYCAVLHREDSGLYSVEFPDFTPEAATCGDDLKDALHMAKDVLEGYLTYKEDNHQKINPASDPAKIKVDDGDILTVVNIDTNLVRARDQSKLVKKTVTIPSYLNEYGMSEGINFSKILTNALKDLLKV
ncbi:type II toxin-antitoxin system HicB family antitoxin [Xylocopilactobacillus apicola]|uniref:HicB family protein n=1 Tax=Xylocopilactobacillus apicola TaxID=2932184 RepID=A0AAU9D6T0_9LACO|nr:type II toxin-antitoxin system HicB family antitoxin [Xylocopilactobacillus apicola]BDR59559.1 HicB family protein [Xylocopilactobacillus apicola]